ncbi:hypothetical protein PYW08_006101 [Mythimna loreyi]|uniref:Uncharacterized protein n=1 Tax=Mythimna loreyi TaxID=667449 RepID=A0ACC2QMR7_9NEOP|nr:hypothetical protein PYW08_006101 [Mythimna loreyi]
MSHSSCCVVNCKNTGRNSKCKFYRFPRATWKLEQCKKWIAAVKRIDADGLPWYPRPNDLICSAHFIGGKKSDESASPSYIPTIFPSIYRSKIPNESAAMSRYKRLMKKRKKSELFNTIPTNQKIIHSSETFHQVDMTLKCDQECQVDIFSKFNNAEKTFTCNRYIYNQVCDAEIQTEIDNSTIYIKNYKKMKDNECNTPQKTYIDMTTSTEKSDFTGFSSIRNDEQLMDLAGVTFNNFRLLLKTLTISHKYSISKEDRLFILLIKVKTGMTFSALSVLFGVHRTTISRIFYTTLENVAKSTANFVFWPNKDTVQATMPDCFRPKYSNTRVIIDCTEFRIEVPASVDNRVYCYSHYKKGFTAKLLIGITPGGFISFKSKVAGGRKSDSQMTTESGLIDYLDDGDIVLADKGFPEIKTVIDRSGKEVKIVMPPFLKNKREFSTEETQETYNIASVRIHVEMIMQRLRVYQILNKIPENLFYCIDDIVHICCVLVNLQPPIFKKKNVSL